MLLAGDIGGTKTNLALYAAEAELRTPVAEATFSSARYPSLETVVQEFLAGRGVVVERASFGVAGPVLNGEAKVTNLPWRMSEARLAAELGIPRVGLLNDLAAIAFAVPHLTAGEDLHILRAGMPAQHGAQAIIAPGTGLGEAFLTYDQSGNYSVHASEGGHSGFAPADEEQLGLLRHLFAKHDHVSCERVCSGGMGIPNIYTYLRESGACMEPQELARQLAVTGDPTPIIVNAALEGERAPAIAARTLALFVAILGAEAGNLALKVLATGGVYLGGGIPPRILPLLEGEPFRSAFRHKGRFAELLDAIPLYIIRNPKVALLGAARHALEL